MNRRGIAVLGLFILAAGTASCSRKTPEAAFDAETYTDLSIGDADSLDPAWSYDTHSHKIILNVYEPLFFFDGTSTEKLIPLSAEQVPSRANGLISKDGRTYTIPIRKGVKFHDGSELTAEDARYSLLRFMLQDRDAGPSSLLLQPLLGYPSTRDEKSQLKPSVYADAVRAVSVQDGRLVLRLPKPYPPLLTIVASWAPMVSKDWAAKNGDWDGTEESWKRYNNPKKETSPFFARANGTGPFKLERWDRKTKEIVLARHDAYWRGPAKLKRVIDRGVNEFGTRKLMLQAGDADSIYADYPHLGQLEGLPGVALLKNLPMIEMNPIVFFTFQVNPTANNSIGSGKLDGEGIPPDFFSDKDLRKAFAYSFDYAGFIRDVNRGYSTQATGGIPASLPGHNPDIKPYTLDLAKAEAHFRKAWGGKVWEKGFRFTLTHNSGNVPRETICQMLKRSVESLNPKFRLDVRPVEWPTFLDSYRSSKLPLFIIGWQADYPDAHNFAFPLMHSEGDYPSTQKYKNPEMDRLIDAAVNEGDAAKRQRLYRRLQEVEHEEVPHLLIHDTARFRTQRDWVKGFVHNPVFPDSPWGTYYYTISKERAPAASAAN